MTRPSAGPLGVVVAAVALLAGAVQVQAVRERRFPPSIDDEDALYLTSGTAVRRLAGAYDALASDLYWIRTIQYYGGTKRRLGELPFEPDPPPLLAAVDHPEYRELYPLLDITTTLDPRFNIAYRFGAVFLAESFPAGAGRPDLAVALLEKGLRARPDKWEYMQDIGFVHYWYRHDFRMAGEWFEKASQVPNAPWWLRSLAATTIAEGGDRATSRVMWESIRQSAEIDWLRKDAERRLLQLKALDQMDALQAAVDAFAARAAAVAPSWGPVARANGWPGVPVDPTGARYDLGADGRVRLSQRSPLWPLPDEPQKSSPARPGS